MISVRIVRSLSTKSFVDKWFNALQSKTHEEQQTQLARCIEDFFQQDQFIYSNLIRDIIQRWAIEQPTTDALLTCEVNSDTCQKLTFHDIYTQSSHWASVLTGNGFDLTAGKNVLVVLPYTAKERLLIQFACFQSGLVFHSSDPRHLNEQNIRQQIRTLAIDCIITNTDYLETIRNCTYNSLRPLKQGLISSNSMSKPLPIGWHYLMHNASDIEKKGEVQPTKIVLRHLASEQPINAYSQTIRSLRLLLIAYWLNVNKSPRLLWMKKDHDKISFAPWLLGSTIFHKPAHNIKTMFQTFEDYPIDTFCTSQYDYQKLDQDEQQQNHIHLQRLLSTGPILDPKVKSQWHSLTNLHIQDDCSAILADLNSKSDVQSILKSTLTNSKYNSREHTKTTTQN